MKTTKKQAGILTGMLIMAGTALVAKEDCCVLCGECSYTPTYTPTYTTTTTTSSGCVFCGEGSYTTVTTVSGGSKIYPDFSKSQTLSGSFSGPSGGGTAALKVGKISNKGKVKVSATLKSTGGKKYTASVTVDADAASGSASGTLPFSSKNVGAMSFEISADETQGLVFSGSSDNGYSMESYEVDDVDVDDEDNEDNDGVLGNYLAFSVDGGDLEAPEDYDILSDLLPMETSVTVNSKGKWTTGSAPSIKYKKYKEDGETYYELTGVDDENKTNYSGLKLSFNSKKGTFSGSFKIYATNEGSTEKKPKLKKYTAKVSGSISGSGGSGTATVKIGKVKYSLPVTIETVDAD
ncbi:MAG: hypothetical protein II649_09205 [Kiritimatiellae bacterium]|nr:hypothetical protein [Kiritimatiellia bacterium]